MDKIIELIDDNLEFVDSDLLYEKELLGNTGVNTRYVTLLKNYKVLFEKYLINILHLDNYDRELENSRLLFAPVKTENMDCYQATSTLNLKYIYLRNYLHVEKLSVEDINRIINLSLEELNQPSKELYKLVSKTCRDVIDSNFNSNMGLMRCYGVDSDRFWFDSDVLVFGMRYDEYEMNGMDDSTWSDNNYAQHQFINSLMGRMKKEIGSKLPIKIGIILYNDHTVKKNQAR